MNAYRMNSIAQYLLRSCIAEGLNINISDVYKQIKSIDSRRIIEAKDGKKYKLELKRVL